MADSIDSTLVELVRVTTTDGIRLDGAWQAADRERASDTAGSSQAAFDAAICLHGVGSNFYGSRLFELLAASLCSRGLHVLRVNTRGHDGFFQSASISGRRALGAAYEIVDECRLDIAAWLEFCADRGARRIALIGHSLGAIKALYSQAYESQRGVRGVLAFSPPRLSYARFQASEAANRFLPSFREAEALLEAGRPEALFQAQFPFPLVLSAGTYVDKYGPEERYNIERFLDRIRSPQLITFGERELVTGGVAFRDLPADLQALPTGRAPRTIETIADADHLYTGAADALADVTLRWLESVG